MTSYMMLIYQWMFHLFACIFHEITWNKQHVFNFPNHDAPLNNFVLWQQRY